MSADPSLSAVTLPPRATAKIVASDVVQPASLVTLAVVPLPRVAIAVNWAVSPTTMRLLAAPMILRPIGAAAEGEVDAGEDEDDPHAVARTIARMVALAVTNGARDIGRRIAEDVPPVLRPNQQPRSKQRRPSPVSPFLRFDPVISVRLRPFRRYAVRNL